MLTVRPTAIYLSLGGYSLTPQDIGSLINNPLGGLQGLLGDLGAILTCNPAGGLGLQSGLPTSLLGLLTNLPGFLTSAIGGLGGFLSGILNPPTSSLPLTGVVGSLTSGGECCIVRAEQLGLTLRKLSCIRGNRPRRHSDIHLAAFKHINAYNAHNYRFVFVLYLVLSGWGWTRQPDSGYHWQR